MARAGGELAEAERAHLTAQSLLCDRQAELVPYPLRQIDEAPADYPVRCGDRPRFNSLCKRAALFIVQDRCLARGLARYQSVRTIGVEADHPVPHDLKCDA